ncbi:MAG: molybdopterin-dependent oxidoreductase [Aquamicrobium sp.]|uniref:molybdopterin-dependent oxidoreductase n=1 Tax=Aquamicrobium sp. TaxID=1872579 RepID=UPI00349E7FFB|nr:molybdopterin-dependent oxidoreductase [Aquamicrobium sp.]
MAYTAAHWGAYRVVDGGTALAPLEDDPQPSRIGRGWLSAATDRQSRILRPAVRRGWLDGDRGAGRGIDSYVEMEWDAVLDLAAGEVERVRGTFGNGAIFAGSYGWASAGRFHHAQSQLRRFLNLAGGFVGARDTYSHAAAEVMFPHLLGLSNREFQDVVTSFSEVRRHCELVLAFGGISPRTAQVASSGTTRHEVGRWLGDLAAGKVRLVNVSPRRGDLDGAEWLPIRPGTDVALMLALAFEIVAAGREDRAFLARCTAGWETLRAYLSGESDGVPKTAEWAAALCDIDAPTIRALALELTERRSMVSLTWGMQRADHGEQPLWAGLALASVIGQIGRPGCGFAFGYGSTTPVGRDAPLVDWPSMPQGVNPVRDYIPVARIADMLLRPGEAYTYNLQHRVYPDIRLVWWTGGNPFHHHQDLRRLDEAWKRSETVIVNEHSWTATARRADIVLPATTPFEREDVMVNRRDPVLLWMSRIRAPMGEARDDYAIFAGLAERLGLAEAFTEGRDAEGWLRHLWARSQGVAQRAGFALPDFETFRAVGRFDVPLAAEPQNPLSGFVADPQANPLRTESGRITLASERIAGFAMDDCPGHPAWLPPAESLLDAAEDELHLVSNQPDTRLHAQNDRGSEALADKTAGREAGYLHPDTAARHGLKEGEVMRLWNARGACLAGVRFDEGMRRDCVVLPTGAWYDPQIVDGAWLEAHGNPNVLTIDKGTSGMAQGNIAHTALVRIARWDGPLPPLTIDRPPRGISNG